ncbi:MAG: histidine kinase [Phyllobacteriaceae bacterium]|nr:histidine kinase [Phyllobacteriaceae bacterium]MBA92040.1 histidine kinase [Phyllobacteriaceae bacterium]
MKTRILIVDDSRTTLGLMEKLVGKIEGCEAVVYDDSVALADAIDSEEFDIAVIDFMMPGINGIDLAERLLSHHRHAHKPVVMITADRDAHVRMEAIKTGVIDFLNKPIEPIEFRARMRNLVRLRSAQRKLEDRAGWLREEVSQATGMIRQREEEIIQRLSMAAGYKDNETSAHMVRMARIAERLARQLGHGEDFCRDMRLAAVMHDIGKVGIREAVIDKPGPLSDNERAHMQTHTTIGSQILSGSSSELLNLAEEIAHGHHERWDGNGYPRRLSGRDIPESARIAAVADVFDALTAKRMYKEAWSIEKTVRYIRSESGKRFDPDCVAAMEACIHDLELIISEMPDEQVVVPMRRRKVA